MSTDDNTTSPRQEFTIGAVTVTRLQGHGGGRGTFTFHDAGGVRRAISDHDGNLERLLDAASQPHSAATKPSGNVRRDFQTS